MRNIGIIGCGGFIGSHLLERLLKEDHYTIVGIDRETEKIEHLLAQPQFSFVQMDCEDAAKVREVFNTCDTIISLAALCNPALYNTIPLEVIASNFTAPLTTISFCSETGKKLIHFSTCEVYGKTVQGITGHGLTGMDNPSQYLLSEDTTPLIMGPVSAQRWSYAAAKQLLERVIYAHGEHGTLEYTIIRPFNFIGSRMDYIPGIDGEGIPRVIACFMEALLLGKPLQLVDGGHNKRSFTDINDAVEAIVRILSMPKQTRNQIFNIGNPDNEVSIRQLAEMMIAMYSELYPHTQCVPEIITVSAGEFYGKGYEDCDRRVPDIGKALQLIGWKPRVRLAEALGKTMISYIEYYGKECAA